MKKNIINIFLFLSYVPLFISCNDEEVLSREQNTPTSTMDSNQLAELSSINKINGRTLWMAIIETQITHNNLVVYIDKDGCLISKPYTIVKYNVLPPDFWSTDREEF